MRDTTMIRSDKGQVLVLVALAIFALLGLAALGIDVGYMYSIRNELQRSADTGALAGASVFTTADWNLQPTKDMAEARAKEFATKDKVAQTVLTLSDVAVGFPRVDHIEVVTSRTAALFFARVLGRDNQVISARAVARAASTNIKGCVKPWAIPLPWVDDNTANGLFDNPGEANSVMPFCTATVVTGCWPVGSSMTLKIGSPSSDNTSPSGQQTSGQFFIIQGNTTDPYQGAADYRDYIAGDRCLDINLNDPVDLMPGNKMGPTVQPVRELIQSGDDWDGTQDQWNDTTFNKGDRLVFVVVYDPRHDITGGGNLGGSGTQAYIPGNGDYPNNLQFAGFYLDSVTGNANDGWISGRYTGIMLSGTGEDAGVTDDIAKHVELVE